MDWALRYRGVLPPEPDEEEPRLLVFWLVLSRLVVRIFSDGAALYPLLLGYSLIETLPAAVADLV